MMSVPVLSLGATLLIHALKADLDSLYKRMPISLPAQCRPKRSSQSSDAATQISRGSDRICNEEALAIEPSFAPFVA